MKRPFWSFRVSSACDLTEPLLPLYTDGMASPAEIRLVEAHLPGCAACRATLAWMQATRLALAARPIAVPPLDLHARIALVIASSSLPAAFVVPVPTRSARVFTLRSVYAAAASLTALGIALTYPLWHTPGEASVKHPVKQAVIANMPGPAVKTPASPKITKHPQVASGINKPTAVKQGIIARKMPLSVTPPLEHTVANNVPANLVVVPQAVKALVHHALAVEKIASRGIAPTEKHTIKKPLPVISEKPITLKLPEVVLTAKVPKEKTPMRLEMPAPTLTPDPPAEQTASAVQPTPQKASDGLGGELRAYAKQVRTASYVATGYTKRLSSRGASDMMHTLGGEEHSAFIPGVYSPR